MPANSSSRIMRFSTFEVNLDTAELRQRGQKVKLQEQPFQVLAALLERPGEVVSREELCRRLWPADTFVDFDHSLNAAIKRLRDALGESSESPVFIETMARRGYRFIAPVGTGASQEGAKDIFSPTPAAKDFANTRAGIRWRFLAALAMVVISLVGALLFARYKTSGAPGEHLKSLAVLPLANLSHDPEQEYFSDGMTEALTDDLAKMATLRVVSRTSAMRYKATKQPLQEIARELNVDGVIEGSVLRSGNRVRITAELIDARTDQHLWGQSYERDLSDVLMLQSEVAQAIALQVRLKLTPEERARLQQGREVNAEAFQAYLRAMSLGGSRRPEIKKAQSYYQYAIQKDPGFAAAYVGLARSYRNLGEFRWLSPPEAYPPAKQAIRKALELDEKDCGAHWTLADLSWRYDWDWETTDRELTNALELCPNNAGAHWHKGWYSGWSGRGTDALAEMAKARELDPLLPLLLTGEVMINYHLRNYKAMVEVGRQDVTSDANSWIAHFLLGVGYEGSGRTLDAIPEYQKAVELSEGDQDPAAGLAHAYAATGRKEEAKKILREWQQQSESNYISPYMIATVYASLGEKDKAFEYLEKAYQERSSDLPYFLRADLRIDSLRSDPRFQNLLRRMNFPQ